MHLEWDFGERAWDAEFVSGPFAGTTRRFCVADLTTERWAKTRASSFVEGDPSRTRAVVQKTIAKEFITRWCEAIASNVGYGFEDAWDLEKPVFETPAKKRRGADELVAAVA